MNKIVCDVCGTSYPDTAAQCPICGNSKANTAYTANSGTSGAEGYAYVKGGRFSHANVKKINNGQTELPRTAAPSRPVQEGPAYEAPVQESVAQQPEAQKPVYQEPAPQPVYHEEPPRQPRRRPSAQQRKKERTTNLILMGIVVILVVAILAVCIFLVTKLLDMNKPTEPNPGPGTTTTMPVDPTGTTTTVPPYQIPCTGVRLSMPSYAFNAVGEKLLLTVTKQPANTTDPVIFSSSDPQIARVDSDGLVVAVADGTVIITVTCGEFSATCEITCDVGVEPTYPPEPTNPGTTNPTTGTTKPTEPKVNLELNSADITMKRKGETHNLYTGELDPGAITWTSSNTAVATVQNGIVTAVANGTATITAEYQGQTKTCIVRVDIPVEEENVEFTLSQYEAMIAVGQSFTLKAYDADGNQIDPSELTFEIEAISEEEGEFFTVDENGVITGVKYNLDWKLKYKTLRVTYKGKTLTCMIYVKNAE